jgi:sigma-B regulation protein RsbU (phosphoserine phosphatase)
MLKHILKLTVIGIVLIGIYSFLRLVLYVSETYSLLIMILLFLSLKSKFDLMGEFISDKMIPRTEKIYIQFLDHFDTRLNDISHYHELLSEFYRLFNLLFPRGSWLFYVFENSAFQMVKYDTSKVEDAIPDEIKYPIEKNGNSIQSIKDLKNNPSSDLIFDPAIFLENKLEFLIPIAGKNQTVALLFSEEQAMKILQNKVTSERFEKSLIRAGQILENTALYLDVIQLNLELKKIFEVSQKLLTSMQTEDILEFLLDALSEVVSYDAGVIFLFDPDSKKLYKKVSKGYEAGLDLTLKMGQGACGWVVENKQISLIKNVESADHYYPIRPQTKSQVSIPLEIQNEMMGVLSLESNDIGYFTSHSIELLKLFANQAVIALFNAKQYEISLTKKHLEHELVNAAKVQKVLLPQRAPIYEHLQISFSHISSKLVSGDLFDLAAIDDHTLGLVVGDVSGKGAGAAIMMSLVLAGFRAYKKSRLTVCEIVARLNNLLEESVSEGRFATLFYALISTEKKQITFTNAGHNPPFLFRENGTIEELTGGGIILGYLANQVYTHRIIPFKEGDLLLTYTDGITEAMNIDDEEFGEERLKQVVMKNYNLSPLKLRNKILEEVENFTKSDHITDDQTMVIVKFV